MDIKENFEKSENLYEYINNKLKDEQLEQLKKIVELICS